MTDNTNAERQARWRERQRNKSREPLAEPLETLREDLSTSGSGGVLTPDAAAKRGPGRPRTTPVGVRKPDAPYYPNRKPWDARTRERIKVGLLITTLQKCADGNMELSMVRLRAIEILLKKVVPDLSRTIVQADVNVRYVVRLPDVLSKEDWLRRYGDPKQIEGTVNEPPETLQ